MSTLEERNVEALRAAAERNREIESAYVGDDYPESRRSAITIEAQGLGIGEYVEIPADRARSASDVRFYVDSETGRSIAPGIYRLACVAHRRIVGASPSGRRAVARIVLVLDREDGLRARMIVTPRSVLTRIVRGWTGWSWSAEEQSRRLAEHLAYGDRVALEIGETL